MFSTLTLKTKSTENTKECKKKNVEEILCGFGYYFTLPIPAEILESAQIKL